MQHTNNNELNWIIIIIKEKDNLASLMREFLIQFSLFTMWHSSEIEMHDGLKHTMCQRHVDCYNLLRMNTPSKILKKHQYELCISY
jgi:hypothetical protein